MTQVTITDKKLYGILGISLDGSNKLKIEEELLKKLQWLFHEHKLIVRKAVDTDHYEHIINLYFTK